MKTLKVIDGISICGIAIFLYDIYKKYTWEQLIYIFDHYAMIVIVIIGSVFLYYAVVFVHEVGHAIAAKIAGFPILFFVIGPLLLTKVDGKSNIRFRLKGPLIQGGCVMPYFLRSIQSENDWKQFYNKYLYCVRGGCISSLLLHCILAVLLVCTRESVICLGIIYCWLNNWIILRGLFKKNGNVIGDYLSIQLLKKEPQQLIGMFYNNLICEYPVSPYIKNKFIVHVEEQLKYRELNQRGYLGLNNIVLLFMLERAELPKKIEAYCDEFLAQNWEKSQRDMYGQIILAKCLYNIILYKWLVKKQDIAVDVKKYEDFVKKEFRNNDCILQDVMRYVEQLKMILVNNKQNDRIAYI